MLYINSRHQDIYIRASYYTKEGLQKLGPRFELHTLETPNKSIPRKQAINMHKIYKLSNTIPKTKSRKVPKTESPKVVKGCRDRKIQS